MTKPSVTAPALLLLVATGCAGVPARSSDRGSALDGVPVHAVPVHGYLAQVTTVDGGLIEGELLAVDERQVWVLGGAQGPVWSVGWIQVRKVAVQLHANRTGWYTLWSLAGLASSATHGWLALISVPLWAVGGSAAVATSGPTSKARVRGKRPDVQGLAQYARFPAGPPPSLSRFMPRDCTDPCSAMPAGVEPPSRPRRGPPPLRYAP
jgi:hypothetical protein